MNTSGIQNADWRPAATLNDISAYRPDAEENCRAAKPLCLKKSCQYSTIR